jgi:hypothetical protein
LPATVIIGKDGKVYKTISGIVNQTDLRKDVEKLLQDAEKQAKIETKKQTKIPTRKRRAFRVDRSDRAKVAP